MASTTSTTQKPFHIAICGGGIGGLALAIGLIHRNVSVTVYEAAHKFAEIGAGVSFGPNTLHAMSMIHPAIRSRYETIDTRNAWPSKRDFWFDFQLGMTKEGFEKNGMSMPRPEGAWIASPRSGTVGQSSIHRAHFLDQLIGLVPEGVGKFGKKVERVERIEESGKMKMWFHDGTTAEADAVVGCDGIKSACRVQLLGPDHPAAHPVFTGKYAYRGLIPMEVAAAAIGDEKARNAQMYLGRHGHILTVPIEKGKTMNVVAFRTKADGKWEDERWVLPLNKEDLINDFKDFDARSRHIIALMEKPDIWALFNHPPAPTYYKGRLALLGDAAHASTPHQGAGAGQAIEDALVLSWLLGKVESADGIEDAFRAYDAVRRERSQKVVTTSAYTGRLYEFEDEEIGSDLEKMGKRLEEKNGWIWDFDFDRHLEDALEIMNEKKA